MNFLLGELFCGPGGMALGAGLAGQAKKPIRSASGESYTIHHLWGVDKDEDAIATYSKNVAERFGGEGICTDALKFVPMAGFEAEAVGLGHKEQTTLNMYGYVKFNLTNRLILSYACNPQFVWDKRTSPEYDMLSGTTHYVRLSLTVGKPARMMM